MAGGCQGGPPLNFPENKAFLRPDDGLQRLGEVGGKPEPVPIPHAARVPPTFPPQPSSPCFFRCRSNNTAASWGEVDVASIVNSGSGGGSYGSSTPVKPLSWPARAFLY